MVHVEIPAPDRVAAALLERLDAPTAPSAPLAVIDPAWPQPMREQALADLVQAAEGEWLTADDLAVFTSGSSGNPRAVVRTLASWRASLEPLSDVTGMYPVGDTAGDVGTGLVWVPGPLTSSLFLYGALHAGWCGLPWAGGRPDGPDAQPATSAHLVPAQLADALVAMERGLLRDLRTVVVAGAALPAALRARAERRGLRVVEYYGSAELSFVGWRDDAGPFHAFPGAEVRVGDDRVVWVRSPYVATSYLRPDAQGPWRRQHGWHTVGDLARPDGDGWWLLGRGDSAITTGGYTVLVAEVEAVLREVRGVQDVVVLGMPHDRLGQVVCAVVVTEAGAVGELRRRLEAEAHALPAAARPRRWLRADRLPLLPSGKVDRPALVADAADLEALH
jgi:acyl-CoA synthetase (AMP-forming)/AMP-acid ligase II